MSLLITRRVEVRSQPGKEREREAENSWFPGTICLHQNASHTGWGAGRKRHRAWSERSKESSELSKFWGQSFHPTWINGRKEHSLSGNNEINKISELHNILPSLTWTPRYFHFSPTSGTPILYTPGINRNWRCLAGIAFKRVSRFLLTITCFWWIESNIITLVLNHCKDLSLNNLKMFVCY